MSEGIKTSLNVLVLLRENVAAFEYEANYIHDLKCYLISGGDLDEYAEVRHFDGEYYYLDGFKIRVKEGVIIDFEYE
ncbi:MAG: hypothetical protein ACI4WM_03565 [Erysipelotrichaceae bacterium]